MVKKKKVTDFIEVRGAAEHNLKSVDVDIPKGQMVVMTGVSGSGKSSLAFDTIFAEGQRRYVESLSAYARQFLGQLDKPKYESIRGLCPTIAIEQKSGGVNPRSTVGTMTEIYDYLRVLFARLGLQHCVSCDQPVGQGHLGSMVRDILKLPVGTKIQLLAPQVENRKGEFAELFSKLRGQGYVRARVDGVMTRLESQGPLAKNKKHHIEVVVDRLVIAKDTAFQKRLRDSLETAAGLGEGRVILHREGRRDKTLSAERTCCGYAYPELEPQLFSFNSPLGMCETCDGLGHIDLPDESRLVLKPHLSFAKGALNLWDVYYDETLEGLPKKWFVKMAQKMTEVTGCDYTKPWQDLSAEERHFVLCGFESEDGFYVDGVEDILRSLEISPELWQTRGVCTSCRGHRLNPTMRAVRVGGVGLHEVCTQSLEKAAQWAEQLNFTQEQLIIAKELLKEIRSRLKFLLDVGLHYLHLGRSGATLSGGEAQRIRLASQIGSELTGVLYVLDEPSIGLHQRDQTRLLQSLKMIRDLGNTILMVEHDQETMEEADWVIDIGPRAGELGGEIIAVGDCAKIQKSRKSLTGQYLSGKKRVSEPRDLRQPDAWLLIDGIQHHNLENAALQLPVGLLTTFTGVSGAGKSSLVKGVLYPAIASRGGTSTRYKSLEGHEAFQRVKHIDQKPIGRTPRSNPATYTKLFDLIRDLFAQLPESRERGYKAGRFSFNVAGGRCDLCHGAGVVRVEMHFLADVFVPCQECEGRRFNGPTLEVFFLEHSIADILDLTVAQALKLFENQVKIKKILQILYDVGLGYLQLGQSATTLSGGEAQRIRLAKELAGAARSSGVLYILDEPTTGLHFDDIHRLMLILHELVDHGHTVVVVEHNLDVVVDSDWVIDLGPEGGQGGGVIQATGTPEEIAKTKTHTGLYLKKHLQYLKKISK